MFRLRTEFSVATEWGASVNQRELGPSPSWDPEMDSNPTLIYLADLLVLIGSSRGGQTAQVRNPSRSPSCTRFRWKAQNQTCC